MSAPASPVPPTPAPDDSLSSALKSTADRPPACLASGSGLDEKAIPSVTDPNDKVATVIVDGKPVSVAPADMAMKPDELAGQDESQDVGKPDVVQEEAAQPEQELQADRDQKEAQGEPGTKPTSEEEEEKEEEEDEDEEGEEGEEAPRESNLAANTAVKTDLEPDMKGESIEDDPNLAVVISFLTKFGAQCGLEGFNLEELETHLESREEVLPKWMQLHIKLLRKINKSVTPAKWERSLVKFVYLVSTDDGWDLEKFGYRLVPSTMKLRILKSLLESQFDFNVKFKSEVNKQDAPNLRCHPLGWDKLGNAYWYNMDDEANLRVYKEDPDEETWELAARSKDEFLELIGQLKTGATYLKRELTTIKSEEPALEDDDDDPQELANIIRDTGPVPESCQTSYGNSDDDDDSRPLQIDEGPAKESDPEESKGESDSAKSIQAPKTMVTPSSVSISPPSVDPAPSSDATPPLSVAPAPSTAPVPPPSAAPVPPSSDAPAPTPVPSTTPTPTPAPVSAPAPSPPKKSHYSIESLISKDDRHMKRPLEVENGSPNAEKRPKLAPSETISEPTMLVVGQGNGVDNKDAPEPRPAEDTHSEEDEVIEEPVMVFSGFGSGADNLARNPDNDNDSNSNGVDHEEKKLGESELKSVKRGHPESTKETMAKEDQIKSDPEDMEEDEPKPKRGKEDEELKSNGKDESACDTKEDKKTPKKKKHLAKKGQDPEDEDEPILRSSRRTSSRIATLRIREAERRQKEEENALDDFREKMRRKAEREQNRLDKYRAMGREFEREMAKTRKRGKAETSDEDYEDEGEGNKTATKRKRRKKKKKKRGEENLREFAKFSSGSSDDEGLEGEEDEDLEGEHEEDDQDEVLFHSDHEFSCESDVPDGEAQPIQHARTATKGKKRRKKARKTESVEAVVAAESESEEDDSDDNWACKKCNKRDHPEWILLCDKCDDGWHASCLRPSLMVIPEGSWFCPNCQHAVLLTKLEENLVSFEVLLKKKDAETKRKERLAFVSMSLSNILPPKATSSGAKKPANKTKSENPRRHVPRKRHRSDDSFSGSSSGSSSDGNSTSSEEEEPVKDGRRRATRNVSYSLKAYDDMIRSAIADEVVYLPVAGQGKAIEAAAPDDDEEDGEGGEDEEEEENVEQAKSSTGQSGLGRGKDMANILGADDDEEEGASAKEKDDDDDDDKDEIVPSDVPQPIKMEIQKDIPSGKGKKKAKKSKKFGALSSSDDGDGDSGSDFVASEISLEEDEEDEEEFLDDAVSSDDGGLGTSSRKKSSRAATRKSNRNRKVMYDEDFVFDGSDSEDDPSKKKKKRRKNDDSWDSEISLEDDEEEYGSKKKKKSSSKKKSRLKYDSLSSEEDDEDFEASISKKKQRILSDTSAQRKTRGKKIQFEWEESDDDSDVPLRRSKAPSSSASKKKKGGKKRVDDTDTEMEDYQSEPELDDDEEEDSD